MATHLKPRGGRLSGRPPLFLTAAALLMSTGAVQPAAGQIVRGQVVDSITGSPIAAGIVLLLDSSGTAIARTRTDEEGLFLIRAPAADRYRLRAEGQGYRGSTFPPFALAPEAVVAYRLLVPAIEITAATAHAAAEQLIARVCPDGLPQGLPVIVGQVVDGTTNRPVPNAEVELIWSNIPDLLAGQPALSEEASGGGVAVSGDTGFYGVCGAPVGTEITMIARSEDHLSDYTSLTFERPGVRVGDSVFSMDQSVWRQDLVLEEAGAHSAVLTGVVVDSGGRQIESARVHLLGTRLDAATNRLGAFRIAGVPEGPVRLQVQRFGYHPRRVTVQVTAGRTNEAPLLRMTPIVTQLAPISVEARAEEVRRNLAEFNRRRETTTGSFITRAEFAEMGSVQVTADVLRRMRGLRVEHGRGISNKWVITSSRGGGRTARDPSGRCFPIVFRDRVYVGTTATVDVDQAVPLQELEAVEVYTSTASLPAEFNRGGATCGVIAFWTR